MTLYQPSSASSRTTTLVPLETVARISPSVAGVERSRSASAVTVPAPRVAAEAPMVHMAVRTVPSRATRSRRDCIIGVTPPSKISLVRMTYGYLLARERASQTEATSMAAYRLSFSVFLTTRSRLFRSGSVSWS